MMAEIRVIGSILLLFFLPGMSLVWAFFPNRNDLEITNRIGLSIGLSITISAVVSVLLNYSPWGIQGISVSISLLLISVIFGLIAYFRRARLLPKGTSPKIENIVGIDRVKIILVYASTILVFLTILVALLFLGIGFAFDLESDADFTEFFIVPLDSNDEYYPNEIPINQPATLILGIVNHEGDVVDYRIGIFGDDKSWERNVRLANNRSWEGEFTFTFNEPCDNCRLYFVLYKGNDTVSYRSLHVTVTAISPTDYDG